MEGTEEVVASNVDTCNLATCILLTHYSAHPELRNNLITVKINSTHGVHVRTPTMSSSSISYILALHVAFHFIQSPCHDNIWLTMTGNNLTGIASHFAMSF